MIPGARSVMSFRISSRRVPREYSSLTTCQAKRRCVRRVSWTSQSWECQTSLSRRSSPRGSVNFDVGRPPAHSDHPYARELRPRRRHTQSSLHNLISGNVSDSLRGVTFAGGGLRGRLTHAAPCEPTAGAPRCGGRRRRQADHLDSGRPEREPVRLEIRLFHTRDLGLFRTVLAI